MFGDNHFGDTFNKLLGHQGGKLFYISKREDDGDVNMIEMVIFAVLEKENQIEGSYILQLKTTADHFVGVNKTDVHKFRGNGIGTVLIDLVKCYTYGVSTKVKSDVVLRSSNDKNKMFFLTYWFSRNRKG